MVEELFHEVENYVSCLQNTGAQFIATKPIMELCLEAEQRTGSRMKNQWWDQEVMDVEGMRTVDREAEQTEEEDTDGTETETD